MYTHIYSYERNFIFLLKRLQQQDTSFALPRLFHRSFILFIGFAKLLQRTDGRFVTKRRRGATRHHIKRNSRAVIIIVLNHLNKILVKLSR